MPTVPQYEGIRVAQSGLPNARFDAPTMPDVAGQQAQDMARGLSQAGDGLARIALRQQEEANQIRVTEAMNKAVEEKLRLTYDPEAGFSMQRGKSALERPDGKALDDEYSERLNTSLTKIEAGLGNDAQRQAFRLRASQLATDFKGRVTQHLAKEFNDYKLSVHDGAIATATNMMGMAWGDADELTIARDAIKASVAEKAKMLGLAGQQTEQAMILALSPGHAAVVASAVDAGKVDYAREYLKQHNAELTNEARLRLTRLVDEGAAEERAQAGAEAVWAMADGNATEALKLAREKFSGKEEDAVVTRIKTFDAEKTTLRERAQRDAADQAWRVYADTGSIGKIPLSVRNAMDGRDLAALRRTAKADAEAAIAKREVKTDPNVYYALSVAAATDPNFKNEDLRRFFDTLSPGDRKHFIDLQANVAKPDEQKSVETWNTQKDQTALSVGLKKDAAAAMYIEADRALEAERRERGRELTFEERQKVLDRLVLPGEVKAPWYKPSPNMRLFESRTSGREADFMPEFSDADRRRARAALERQGVANPSKQQVEDTLLRYYQFKKD